MNEEKILGIKVNLNEFTYLFFYPAIFGSMLYDLLPQKPTLPADIYHAYLFKVTLVIFYFVDYLHLNFKLNKDIKLEDRSFIYIFLDLVVSVLLFVSIKFIDKNMIVATYCILFIPICFLIYNSQIGKGVYFYSLLSLISVGLIYFFIYKYFNDVTFEKEMKIKHLLLILVTQTILYSCYSLFVGLCKEKDQKIRIYFRKKENTIKRWLTSLQLQQNQH